MVDLSGNPFNRECDILWLRSALLSDVVCASPLAVSNRTLHTLSDDQLGCPTALNSNSVLIAVSATGGVLLFILTLTFLLWRFRPRNGHWSLRASEQQQQQEDESTPVNRTPDCHNEEECF